MKCGEKPFQRKEYFVAMTIKCLLLYFVNLLGIPIVGARHVLPTPLFPKLWVRGVGKKLFCEMQLFFNKITLFYSHFSS